MTLSSRYASPEMSHIFSKEYKHSTWRKLWVALASEQKKMGLSITEEQILSLKQHIHDIDFEEVKRQESICHHDVMAHILTFGKQCPLAKGIIHLGATSSFVTDNTDLIQMKEGMRLLLHKLVQVARNLSSFARQYHALPTLSYTHFQPAQPTTVGKRASLWLQDLMIDIDDFEHHINTFPFLGLKGATGTQASFLILFEGDHKKVETLEKNVTHAMGFSRVFPIASQTYTRKQDVRIFSLLTSLASSSHKMATDLRLLSHLHEIEEPFHETQVGSSAMPHKRNPIYSERICGLARSLMSLQDNALYTEATQWLERSLDDSSNRRLSIPESFLLADAVCNLLLYITSDLVVHPQMIASHLKKELPFLSTEPILMELAKRGKDRQKMHEILKKHAHKALDTWKRTGTLPDLIEIFSQDKEIGLSFHEIIALSSPETLIGRASEQTISFLDNHVDNKLSQFSCLPSIKPTTPL